MQTFNIWPKVYKKSSRLIIGSEIGCSILLKANGKGICSYVLPSARHLLQFGKICQNGTDIMLNHRLLLLKNSLKYSHFCPSRYPHFQYCLSPDQGSLKTPKHVGFLFDTTNNKQLCPIISPVLLFLHCWIRYSLKTNLGLCTQESSLMIKF